MYAVVDIETTGSHPGHDHIIEIAVYLHDGREVTGEFCTLLNPGQNIPPFIARLTGISDQMVQDAPTFQEIAEKLKAILDGRIFVAHNVQFDHSFVKQSLARHGHEFDSEMLCTIKAGRSLVPGLSSYKLSSICRSLDIPLNNAHRAYADALATANLLTILNDKANGNLQAYLYRKEIRKNPSRISEELLDGLPSLPGLLQFTDDNGQIIMVAAASNIRKKAWALVKRFHHKKLLPLALESASVQYELTGSELLAQIRETMDCKHMPPRFNRKQKQYESRFGITDRINGNGSVTLKLEPYNEASIYHRVFASQNDARRILKEVAKKFNLPFGDDSQQVDLFVEPDTDYPNRLASAIEWLQTGRKNYLVQDKLMQTGEHVIFLIEDEKVNGYCHLQLGDSAHHLEELKNKMTRIENDPAIYRTVQRYISRGKSRKVIDIKTT